MNFIKKAGFGTATVILTNDVKNALLRYPEASGNYLQHNQIHDIKERIERIEHTNQLLLIETPSLDAFYVACGDVIPIYQAGGGVITNEKGDILMIFRRGKWDMAKGKLDPGETIEQCSVREVMEETGVKNVLLGKLITVTLHFYFLGFEHGKKLAVKQSYWYQMSVQEPQNLVAQIEEDITDIRWVAPAELHNYAKETYPSIIEVLNEAGYTI